MKKKLAYTIMELMVVVICITTLVLTSGILDYRTLSLGYLNQSVKEKFVTDFIRSQNISIQQGCRGIITIGTNINGLKFISYGCDYIDYDTEPPIVKDSDANALARCPSFISYLPKHYSITFDNTVIINSRGLIINHDSSMAQRNFIITYNDGSISKTIAAGNILTTGMIDFT